MQRRSEGSIAEPVDSSLPAGLSGMVTKRGSVFQADGIAHELLQIAGPGIFRAWHSQNPGDSRADPETNIIDVGGGKEPAAIPNRGSCAGQSDPTNKQASGAHIHKMLSGDLVSRGIA